MATPYLDEAERCSRVALLSNGKLLVLDTPQALREGLSGVMFEVIARPQDDAIEALGSLAGAVDIQAFGERVHVRCTRAEGDAAARKIEGLLRERNIEVTSVREIPATLEDVFINRVAVS